MSEKKEYEAPEIYRTEVLFQCEDGTSDRTSYLYKPFKTEKAYKDFTRRAIVALKRKRKKQNKPKIISYEWKRTLIGKYRWWLEWFNHATDQKFNSDEEALEDFRDFCLENKYYHYDILQTDFKPWCPMGADEYWRHQVCHCKGCKKSGLTRIKH